jgi:membrane-bound metal-dependent hydrolase YbcI (DUF457 family)
MHGFQHKRMGMAAGAGVIIFTIITPNSPPELIMSAITLPMGAMLPDIDHDMSKIGRTRKQAFTLIRWLAVLGIAAFIVFSYMSGGMWNALLNLGYVGGMSLLVFVVNRNKHVKKQLGFITKHRGIMHTLVPPAFILGTTLWTSNPYFLFGIYGLVAGYIVHLLGDMPTEEGAPLLWPLTKANIRYAAFNTARGQKYIQFICNAWCVLFVLAGAYFGMKGGF